MSSLVGEISPDRPIMMPSGCTFETVAGQFQKYTSDIISVRNGTNLIIYKSGAEIPSYLRYESSKMVSQTKVMEVYFKNTRDRSLHAFFHSEVKAWIVGGRPGGDLVLSCPAKDVTSTPSVTTYKDQEHDLVLNSVETNSEWTIPDLIPGKVKLSKPPEKKTR